MYKYNQTRDSISHLDLNIVAFYVASHCILLGPYSYGYWAAELPTSGIFNGKMIKTKHFVLVYQNEDGIFMPHSATTLS